MPDVRRGSRVYGAADEGRRPGSNALLNVWTILAHHDGSGVGSGAFRTVTIRTPSSRVRSLQMASCIG
jgi:hypothetical protein